MMVSHGEEVFMVIAVGMPNGCDNSMVDSWLIITMMMVVDTWYG